MGINSLTNPTNPLSPLNPLNPASPLYENIRDNDKSIFSGKEVKSEKSIDEEKLKQEIKGELNSKEFQYLKLATKEFDVFKEKIDKLGLPNKEKILDKIKEYFYSAENTEKKYYIIKGLNNMLDELGSLSKEEIMEKINDTKFWSDFQEGLFWAELGEGAILLVYLVLAILGLEIAGYGAIFMVLVLAGTKMFDFLIEKDNYNINSLFDSINDIYPDITREEFEKIIKLVDNEEFNINEFKKILDKYYEDGKITKQEHKEIEKYLDNLLVKKYEKENFND